MATAATVQKNPALKLGNEFGTEFIPHPKIGLRRTSETASRANAKSCVLTTNVWFAVSRQFRGSANSFSRVARL
jgi:hypothetical protein